jgi:exonuclease III
MNLDIISYNVNGLHDREKLTRLLTFINRTQIPVWCIQEAHLSTEDFTFLKSIFTGDAHYSPHPTQPTAKAGVLFLLKKTPDLTAVNPIVHTPGHCLSLELEWRNEKMWLCNVYVPTEGPKAQFMQNLPEPPQNALPVYAGDWNCIENPSLDKFGGVPNSGTNGYTHLEDFMGSLSLEDHWRATNPGEKAYTWLSRRSYQGTPTLIGSRLDRFYTPEGLRPRFKTCCKPELNILKSDHLPLCLSWKPVDKLDMGKGYWMFNTSLLQDPEYLEDAKSTVGFALSRKGDFPSPIELWDWLKSEIKKLSIVHSVAHSKFLAQEVELAKAQHEVADILWKSHPNDPDYARNLETKKSSLEDLINRRLEGARTRSRATWLDKGESNSKMFAQLEKERQTDRVFRSVLIDGQETTDSQGIKDHIRSFYENLYSAEPREGAEHAQANLYAKLDRKVSPADSLSLDSPITLAELKDAVFNSGNGKSPGMDGIPVEWYKTFWEQIGPLYWEVVQSIFDTSSLPLSQRNAVITLLHKKNDRREIKNWRPISLLPADFKVIGKVLSTRLAKVLPSIIHPTQTSIKGRWIMDSVYTVQCVYEYLMKTGDPGGILYLDQEKAFDRVDHDYLMKTLSAFEFGPSFRKWIDILYKDAWGTVKVNNHLTQPFKITRGVRQGCPLSPLLFTIAIEPFANAIRKHEGIRGIRLAGCPSPIQTSLYADDTTLFFSDPSELTAIKEVMKTYQMASNAKFNASKCQGAVINMPLPPPHLQLEMEWLLPNHHLIYLGIPIGTAVDSGSVWTSKLQELHKLFARWTKRSLSLTGRVVVSKMLAIPKLIYLAQALDIPEDLLSQLTTSVWSFVWKGKRDKVSRSVMSLPYDRGGQKMLDPGVMIASLHCKAIKRLLASDSGWALYTRTKLTRECKSIGIPPLLLFSCVLPKTTEVSRFWTQAVRSMQTLDPTPTCDPLQLILHQPLLFNPRVRIDGKPLTQHQWRARPVRFLHDLWRGDHFASISELRPGIQIISSTRQAYIDAIPLEWIRLLHTHDIEAVHDGFDTLPTPDQLTVHGTQLARIQDFKPLLQGPAHAKRLDDWGTQNWKRIFLSIRLIVDKKVRETLFLFVHRALPVGETLQKWGITATCPLCLHHDSFAHFPLCPACDPIWNLVNILLSKYHGKQVATTVENKQIGTSPFSRRDRAAQLVWRSVHAVVIRSIWVTRVSHRYPPVIPDPEPFFRTMLRKYLRDLALHRSSRPLFVKTFSKNASFVSPTSTSHNILFLF